MASPGTFHFNGSVVVIALTIAGSLAARPSPVICHSPLTGPRPSAEMHQPLGLLPDAFQEAIAYFIKGGFGERLIVTHGGEARDLVGKF